MMTQKEKIIECLEKYAWNICTVDRFYMGNGISQKTLKMRSKHMQPG